MLARVAHRGPDGEGSWVRQQGGWHVALGHRRLAIIDVAGGAQPMANADDSVVITYNGEVYNFAALRARLQNDGGGGGAGGAPFRTRSDTEVVARHFERRGVGGVAELDGMFAFAIWEAGARRLTLARDRAGIKPLYYAELPGGGIAFASELTALLAHGGVDGAVSSEGLASYFFVDYIHPPATIVRGARKLPPGHTLVWQDGRLEAPRAYWTMPAPAPTPAESERTLAEELARGLERAVAAQLVSDVPVGVFLSGGIDSSCVATLAAAAGGRMRAFSIGFTDTTFDESSYAATVAARLNVEHVTETLDERGLLDIVDAALDALDEPMADPSLLPTFVLSRLAARHVKVVLGGDGGDELWGGYPTYLAHRHAPLYGALPAWVRDDLLGAVIKRLPVDDRYQSFEWKLRRFTERWDDDPVNRHLRWMSSVDLPELPRAVPAATERRPGVLNAPLPATNDRLQRMLALDFSTYLPGSVLTKVDRASMAHGLEVRPPLLDNILVDWAFTLPSRTKLRNGRGKHLLKLAVRGRVPDEIIDRPKKGFGVPLARWLRGPLRERLEEVVARSPVYDLGLLGRQAFADWNRDHQERRRDASKPLWALIVLDHWYRRNGRRAT
jgi:asparagine synthase (glutamine-hydrolysing)